MGMMRAFNAKVSQVFFHPHTQGLLRRLKATTKLQQTICDIAGKSM
jgi:hypothetical protein